MKLLRPGIIGIILAVAVLIPLWIQHRAVIVRQSQNEKLRQQSDFLAQMSEENARLSNVVAKAKSSQAFSENELMELLRLRNEVRQLRWTVKGMEHLQSEIRRVHDALANLAKDRERGGPSASTLSTDALEKELRAERLAHLKEWLKEAPAEEKTPELQFVPEESWGTPDWPPVTDEECQGWISMIRGVGELKFGGMAFNAVKAYAKANDGQFPTDLSQLKPYFDRPIDDAVLQRYHIVPANSLPKWFAEVGGDWVITQKSPVNAKMDGRVSIGLTTVHAGPGRGTWDAAP